LKTSDAFDLGGLGDSLDNKMQRKKSPQAFLGENTALVNLDNLVTAPKSTLLPQSGQYFRQLLERRE